MSFSLTQNKYSHENVVICIMTIEHVEYCIMLATNQNEYQEPVI